MIDLSIILVNYNTKQLTLQCVKSIYENISKTISYEIIIVDNNSAESILSVNEFFPEVRIYLNGNNEGFGRANNLGVQKSSDSKFVLFLNTDTIIIEDIFSPILLLMQTNPDIGCVTPFIIYPDLTEQATYGVFPSISSFMLSFFGINRVFKRIYNKKYCYYNSKRPSKLLFVSQVVGVSMFVRRSIFNEIGGFDPDFFLYFEETELCYRIGKKYKIAVFPDVRVIHLLNKSMPTSYFKLCNMEKSRMLYFKKTKGNIWYVSAFISFLKHLSGGIKSKCFIKSLIDYKKSFIYVYKS